MVSSSSNSNKSLFNPIPDKLDETSFVTWQQLALFTINGQKFEDYIIEGKESPQMLHCTSTLQIWKKLHQLFTESIKLKIINFLNALGYEVSHESHIEAICDGLSKDFSSCISLVQVKLELFTIGEVETLLVSHEETLEKFKQLSLGLA
ncbi:hypothetical protein Ahy_A05g022332 [Arachis hypogaea]|uniref:Uncharacterized protein n=1 Tax=Arachis hypogaea TaxID=3818 RepID=A0A445D099_ARAHY|nr:hypothetical protein Ahy_A05g022332 [Arachis hypogaea]